jgi:DNA gyrase subunit A
MSTQDFARHVVPINIEDEMRTSYMAYSMSVIIGRALPDVRDGLKPVHRRILYAMQREGLLHNRKYSKCAGVVGEVLKKYHPHGDSAVYDALVRMAQPWNLRYLLVDGQGNFGSVDGDPAAAYRYTECRMTKLAEELLADIDKETVDFTPNFDGTEFEPEVMPARFPNLLANGADGIAVGMATKIPPHNLGELIRACIAIIEDPDINSETLMELYVPGPDFPTGGFIYGRQGIRDAYTTGRGRIIMRAKTHFEDIGNDKEAIIVDELPFQVNKARLIMQIASLVKDKRIEGITALRDESDRTGMRVVVELRRDMITEVVLNKLFKHTDLQSTFGVILLSIVHGQPRILPLKDMLSYYISHRREVIARRCRFELRKARERAHVLEGYIVALDHIDEVIATIRASRDGATARLALMARYELSRVQAQAILDMRLQRLTGMEREKIEEEYAGLLATIVGLEAILASEELLMQVVKDELIEINETYSDERRTVIVDSGAELDIKDLIAQEDQAVTMTVNGYIKRTRMLNYAEQRRGGLGRKGIRTRQTDAVRDIFIANTHSKLLIFTTHGHGYALEVYEIPESSRDAKGKPIVNLVQLEPGDEVAGVVCIDSYDDPVDLLFCSKKGLVKRTKLYDFRNMRRSGLRSYDCAEGDELFEVIKTGRDDEVLIVTKNGQSIRFRGEDVRPMGRVARGVKGIDLQEDDEIVDLEVLHDDPELLLLSVTAKGYGKRTDIGEYRLQGRGGKGIINIKTGERNGTVAGSLLVHEDDKIMLITDTGRVIYTRVAEIRKIGRSTMGVRIMRVEKDESIVGIARVVEDEEPESTEEVPGDETAEGSDALADVGADEGVEGEE